MRHYVYLDRSDATDGGGSVNREVRGSMPGHGWRCLDMPGHESSCSRSKIRFQLGMVGHGGTDEPYALGGLRDQSEGCLKIEQSHAPGARSAHHAKGALSRAAALGLDPALFEGGVPSSVVKVDQNSTHFGRGKY